MRNMTAPSTRNRKNSRQWFERAQRFLIEGGNSPSRGSAVFSPGPVVLQRGRGARVWDLDANEYADFMMSFGARIHGHAHPAIVQAATHAVENGSLFAST